MQSPARDLPQQPWVSLWVVALLSLLGQLAMCQFFSFGVNVPVSIDIDPSNLWRNGYQWPPTGQFLTLSWLGAASLPPPLNPFTLAAHLPAWWFFTTYTPLVSTAALLIMVAFLRELQISRPAALFGGLVYAWQGDLLPFVFPGHYGYITTWFFFAAAAWGALRNERTGHWAYALISGIGCGMMIGLVADRGAIASLLIGALYLAPACRDLSQRSFLQRTRQLALCAVAALVVSIGGLLALFQSNIVGVKMGGESDPKQAYDYVTQFSLGPAETLTYLVPGFFGWHSNNETGPYWGWIGEWPQWPKNHQGTPNLNLAISTTGTIATVLALIGSVLLLPGFAGRLLGPASLTARQRIYGRMFLVGGFGALILSWGWHTPLYRILYHLPLMDKWRNPLKWLEITNFALITLSALGAQQVFESVGGSPLAAMIRRRIAWFVGGMALLMGIALIISFPLSSSLVEVLKQEQFQPQDLVSILSTLDISMAFALVAVLLTGILFVAAWRPDRLRGLSSMNPWLNRHWQRILEAEHLPTTLVLALAILNTAQLAWVASNFVKPVSLAWMTSSNGLLDALRNEGPAVRVSATVEDPVINQMMQNQFQADQISCLEISAASRIPDDYAAFIKTFQSDPARLYFLAGVKNLAMPQELVARLKSTPGLADEIVRADGYMIAPTDSPDMPSHALVELRDFLAKATLVPQAEVVSNQATMLTRMQDPKWNPRDLLFLEKPAAGALPSTPAGVVPAGEVDLKAYTSTEIDFDVQAVQQEFVLINDQYNPDWSAEIDGHPKPVLRADGFFRALQVPAGNSHVTMHFYAHYRLLGFNLPAAAVNIFSDGSMLVMWIVAGAALRRRPTGQE